MFRLPDWLIYEIQRKWEQLSLRNWLNKNPRLIIGVTAASVFLFLLILIGRLTPGQTLNIETYEKEWFYDLNTGELFVAKSGLAPPIDAPSGPLPNGEPAGAKAYVFSYASEPNESDRFIGFLEIPNPKAQEEKLEPSKPRTGGAQQWGHGRLIRRVDDENWIPANSSEGQIILNKALQLN